MKRTISSVLAAAILWTSSGPAWAQLAAGAASQAAAPQTPVLPVALPGSGSLGSGAASLASPSLLPGTPSLGSLPTPKVEESAPAARVVSQVLPSALPLYHSVSPLNGVVSPSKASPVPLKGAVSPSPAALAPLRAAGSPFRASTAQRAPAPAAASPAPLQSLTAGAASLPRMLSLGGASLKAEAGRLFEGSGRAAGADVPARPGPDSPARLPKPGLSLRERMLLQRLADDYMPGESLSKRELLQLAERAGLRGQPAHDAVRALAAAGHLLELPDRTIFLDLPGEKADGLPSQARADALRALGLLGEGGAPAWLAALGLLEAAAADAQEGSIPRAELEAVRDNAGLKVIERLLEGYRARHKGSEDPEVAAKLEGVSSVLFYLAEDASYFDVSHTPPPLRADDLHTLASVLQESLELALARPGPISTEDVAAVERQQRGLQAFAQRLAALPAPKAEDTAGTDADDDLARRRKEFPLIRPDDKKYANIMKYGQNLTALAVEGKLSPLIGRGAEIERAIEILVQPEKNNPVFTGGPGVGKTKLAEGLAQAIVDGIVPEKLKGVNVFVIDTGALVAGTTLRGQFEDRLKAVLNEAVASKGKVVLFIDELHTIMGLGSAEGSTSANNILKGPISDGSVKVIGATTADEYRKIEKDGALKRRFQEVRLSEPSKDEALAILNGIKGKYEDYYGLRFPEAGLKAAVELAVRYIKDRLLPDSAIDIVRQAGARVMIAIEKALGRGETPRPSEVTPEDMASQLARMTGIPVDKLSKDEQARLKSLEGDLGKRVIGQGPAIRAVAKAVRRGRMDLKEENEPVGVFVFLGPTGVGKTELAKALAENQFSSERSMIRFDMSEFMEKHTVSRLIGAPPGYIGHDGAGELTEKVRKNPYSIVLFDEFEKAHEDIQRILLQIVDDGRLTDSHGNTVDFSNTIIIMTSNVGGSIEGGDYGKVFGFAQAAPQAAPSGPLDAAAAKERSDAYVSALEEKLLPELFGRIGRSRMIVFNGLDRPELEAILDLRLALLGRKLSKRGMTAELTEAARKRLLDDASKPENIRYGARPLKQAIDEQVKDLLSDAMMNGVVGQGDKVLVDYDEKAGQLTARKAEKPLAAMGAFLALPLLGALAFASAPWVHLSHAILLTILLVVIHLNRLNRMSGYGRRRR